MERVRRAEGESSSSPRRHSEAVSVDLIQRLRQAHALNPTPIGDEIVDFYVQFDELLGEPKTEAALAEAVDSSVRVSIVGPTGAGKTSVCEWVLGTPATGLAPMWIPVSAEP